MYKAYYFICGIMKIGMPKYRKTDKEIYALFLQHHPERMRAFFPHCVGQGGAVGNACIPDYAAFALHKNVRSTFGDAQQRGKQILYISIYRRVSLNSKTLKSIPLPFSFISLIFTVFLYLTGSPPNQN